MLAIADIYNEERCELAGLYNDGEHYDSEVIGGEGENLNDSICRLK